MNCQEVTELMQRYLDKDLTETEHNLMLEHQEQCPECTEMFERLQRLSANLESLPKVTPPYSIVDSIMPQLLELDQLQTHSETPQGSVIPIANHQQSTQHEKGKRNRYVSWRWMSGIAAAGVILGVFLFQQQPSLKQNALESLPELASQFNQEDASSQYPMSRSMSPLSVMDQSGKAVSESMESGTTFQSDNVAPKSPSNMDTTNKVDVAPPPSSDTPNSQESQPNSSFEQPSDDTGDYRGMVTEEEKEGAMSLDLENTAADTREPMDVPLTELSSPDEQYMAVLYSDRIEIVQKNNEAIIFLTGESWDPTQVQVSLKGWEEDRLIYERSERGQTAELTIQLSKLDGNERDMSHSPSR